MNRISRWIAGASFTLAAIGSTGVLAATTQGTQIDNVATVNFTVGGVSQSMCSAPTPNSTLLTGSQTCAANGTKTSFKVDTKVDVLVTAGTAQSIQPTGAAIVVTTFTVKNQGNAAQDILLAAAGLAGSTTANGQTTTVSTTGYSCTVAAPTMNASNVVPAVAAGATFTATVSCTVPISPGSGAQWNATAADYGGALLTATAVATGTTTAMANAAATSMGTGNGTDGTGIVLADGAGTNDSAGDAKYSARNNFTVSAALVKVTKTVAILCDQSNGFTSPKFIPGAYVQYTIKVENTGTGSAVLTSSAMVDALQGSMTADANLIKTSTGTPATICSSSGASTFGAGQAVGVVFTGGVTQATRTTPSSLSSSLFSGSPVTLTVPGATVLPAVTGYAAGELKASESLVFTFNAIIP